jgi:hypothetical protein
VVAGIAIDPKAFKCSPRIKLHRMVQGDHRVQSILHGCDYLDVYFEILCEVTCKLFVEFRLVRFAIDKRNGAVVRLDGKDLSVPRKQPKQL